MSAFCAQTLRKCLRYFARHSMLSNADDAHSSKFRLRNPFSPQPPRENASTHGGWRGCISEFLGVVAVYVLLARIGQVVAVPPGNITPVYPAAGFAMACVLCRGPRVWPGIWVGQLLGNAWAFIDFSDAGVAAMTSTAGVFTSCGAVFQALAGAHLIKRWCGVSNPFDELRRLFYFGMIVVFVCVISAFLGVIGLSFSGILAWEDFGSTVLTWYLGDLMGAVLWIPLIMTGPSLVGYVRETHRVIETGIVLSLVVVFSLCVFCEYLPLQLAGNSVFLLSLPLVVWAAFRMAQPGVAILVNVIGPPAAFLTIRGFGPFVTDTSTVAVELLQLYMMVTMMAGLSLAIATEQLRRTQSSFSTLGLAIDKASDAVLLIRPDASFEYVNAQASALLGYSRKALLSMTVFDIDPTFPVSTWPRFWRDKLQTEGLHVETVVRRKNDSEVPVEVSINRLAVDRKELACAIVKDISARRRAQDSRNRLAQILNNSSAVIYEKDLQGRYEFANNCWAQLFNIDPKEIKGKTDYDLFPREMAKAFCSNDRRVIESGQSLRIEEVAPHADGPHTYVSVKMPVMDAKGRICGVAGISTDITEQLAARGELQDSERLGAIGERQSKPQTPSRHSGASG